MQVLIKKLREDAVIPKYATPGAAACDLTALTDAPITLQPGQRALIPTGIAIALPSNEYVALICARSGMAAKRGLTLANAVGVIDSDYRGELKVAMVNIDSQPQTIESGERIAQLMFLPVAVAQLAEAEALPDTERGEGGFGSTGTK